MVSILIQDLAKRRHLLLELDQYPATRGDLINIIKSNPDEFWKTYDFTNRLMTCAQTQVSYALEGARLDDLKSLREAPAIVIAPVKEMRGGSINYRTCPLPTFEISEKGNFKAMKDALIAIRDWNGNRDENLAKHAYFYGTMKKTEVAQRLTDAVKYVQGKLTSAAPMQAPAPALSVNPLQGVIEAFQGIVDRLDKIEASMITTEEVITDDEVADDNRFTALEERLTEIELRSGILNDANVEEYLRRNKHLVEAANKIKATLG